MKLRWDIHPERDQAWFDKETRNMSKRDIAQELQCSFNMSGETLIAGEDLTNINEHVCDPTHKAGFDRNFWVWRPYEQGKKYVLVGDVARGDGADYSAFHIFQVETMEQVGEYRGKVPIDMFATIVNEASKEYGNCLTVIENNNIGISLLEKLKEMEHPNLYYSKKATHEQVDKYAAEYTSGVVLGFTTSVKSRPIILAKLEEFIRNKVIKINSVRLSSELKTFIWKNGKAQAMKGYNDDLVLSCAIACWVRDTSLISYQHDEKYQKTMLKSIFSTRKVLHYDNQGTKPNKVNNYIEEKKQKKPYPFAPFFIK